MAVYWNLGLVTRTKDAADACAAFFRGKRLVLADIEVPLEVFVTERPDGCIVGVWPRGMSHGSPHGNDPRLTTDDARLAITRTFDAWLRDAPPFTAGFFGGEAYDAFLDGPLGDVLGDGFEGLVVDDATWVALGTPAAAEAVRPGRFAWPRSRVP